MLLTELVSTSERVASTASRMAKSAALAELLARLEPAEIVPAVGFLVAAPRQGRVGVGWRGLAGLDVSPAVAATLSIADTDAFLDRLMEASGAGSVAARGGLLRDFAGRATAAEWQFVSHVLLGELRIGALEGVLLDAVVAASGRTAASVRRAAMLSGDLGETALLALTGSAEELDAVGLVVGRPILPMLASTAASAADAIAVTGASSVEYKLDGARIQVHRDGDDVRVFTRNLADITHRVPEIVETVRAFAATSLILDGETLALDEDGGPRPFQETMSRFGSETARAVALQPWFFDLLHLDGRDLIDEPLSLRLDELARIVGGRRMPGIRTSDPADAEELSREALAARHEGVVIKALDSPYTAGRRGKSWIKVKPVHTYDLVVLAAEWGSGRRTGMLSNLHLGALDPSGEFGEPGAFVMVGKTFKGLTDAMLRWQTDRFAQIETRRTSYTVHLEPVIVVEIAIDGVQRSTRYPGGVALRFARVTSYREDKLARDADTIQALREMLR